MRYLILIALSFQSFAGSFIPKEKIGQSTDGMQVFLSQQKCEAEYSKPCIDISSTGNIEYLEVKPEIYLKANAESCSDESDCQSKLESKSCDSDYQSIKNLDLMEVYCTKFVPEHVGENSGLKAAYQEARQAEDQGKLDAKSDRVEAKECIQQIKSQGLQAAC